eukprot:603523-Rhodomonas_salina.2
MSCTEMVYGRRVLVVDDDGGQRMLLRYHPYQPTRVLCGVRYWHGVSYARATQCPAVSGTDMAYAATVSGTDMAYAATRMMLEKEGFQVSTVKNLSAYACCNTSAIPSYRDTNLPTRMVLRTDGAVWCYQVDQAEDGAQGAKADDTCAGVYAIAYSITYAITNAMYPQAAHALRHVRYCLRARYA